MRRVLALLLSVASLLVVSGGIAVAELQSLRGHGDITRMTADNGANAVTARVFGIGRPCTMGKDLSVFVETRRSRILYQAQGVCSAGTQWSTTLYYTATGDVQDVTRVRCSNFEFVRSNATSSFRIVIPRRCLDNAPSSIRVEAQGSNWGSVTGGTAGPTGVLARG